MKRGSRRGAQMPAGGSGYHRGSRDTTLSLISSLFLSPASVPPLKPPPWSPYPPPPPHPAPQRDPVNTESSRPQPSSVKTLHWFYFIQKKNQSPHNGPKSPCMGRFLFHFNSSDFPSLLQPQWSTNRVSSFLPQGLCTAVLPLGILYPQTSSWLTVSLPLGFSS